MKGKPTILCVDDLEANLQIRVLLLQQFGCHTVTASDGNGAMRIAADEAIDLAVIDYHLANGETGEQLARNIRALKPNVPLIMLTGDMHLPDTACECVDAVLTKGLSSPAELLDLIQRLLPQAELHPRLENLH
jgi:CheY-like chemotaxis protein